MNDETKRCPFCDEIIRMAAVKCKHCGSVLADATSSSSSVRDSFRIAESAKHKERAETLKQQGAYEEAEQEIARAIKLHPADNALFELRDEVNALIQEKHLARAIALAEAQKYEDAVFAYKTVLERNPDSSVAQKGLQEVQDILEQIDKHLQQGDAYRKAKQYEDAVLEFEKALEIDPDHPYAKSEAEQCRWLLTEYESLLAKATEDLEAVRAEYESKRYRQAMSGSRSILETFPDHPDAMKLLEMSRRERFRIQRKIALSIGVVLVCFLNVYVLFQFWNYSKYRSYLGEAQAAFKNEEWQEAIEKCKKSLDYRPNDAKANELLTDIGSTLEELAKDARDYAEEARDEAVEARKWAADVKASEFAKELWERASEMEKQADSYYKRGKYESAETYYTQAVRAYEAAEEKSSKELSEIDKLRKAERKRERQNAVSARQDMKTARAQAESEQARKYLKKAHFLAQQKADAANGQYKNRDYAGAAVSYLEASRLFHQCAEDARQGAFLPEGLIKQGRTIISVKDGGEMVLIPDGVYVAGSQAGEGEGNEYPKHRVSLQAFYMDKYEVRIGQFRKFMQETGYNPLSDTFADDSSKDNYPVVGVCREDARAYARWAGKRLPTEAEWEYACRAGKTTRFNIGHKIGHNHANYAGTGGRDRWERTAPVGSFPPNGWGLFDMHGNVWEWCADWYSRNYYKSCPRDNPTGPAEGTKAVMRGGSWKDSDYSLRSANRGYYLPDECGDHVGFRCVK